MKLSAEHTERLHKFSHDLKNRLSGLHEALKHVGESDASEREEFLRFGEQQFFKAMREIESLMDDMEVKRGAVKFQSEPVPLAGIVREAAAQLAHRFDRKEQELKLDLADELQVKGDRHYISNAVTALLSNASKFSPHGSPVLVELKERNGLVELCVIDKGVGLKEEDLRNIFVRYAWLGSRSTAGEAQGRGTLAQARQWMTVMGGDLAAASDGEGKGCSFSMRLPLA